jgi:hypothetical protein
MQASSASNDVVAPSSLIAEGIADLIDTSVYTVGACPVGVVIRCDTCSRHVQIGRLPYENLC